jgi:hypothetical protein
VHFTKSVKWAVQFVILSILLGFAATSAHAAPQHLFNARHQRETAPSIATEPASSTVTVGQTATFLVSASGTAPLTYQWRKNGIPINGATSSAYTTPATKTSDNATQFTVVVRNGAGSATSSAALLTVKAAATSLLSSSSAGLAFGSVNVSSSSTQTVTLTNTGSSSVTISNLLVSGAGFNAGGAAGVILASGQSATLSATFDPAAAGNVTGQITVTSNATNSPMVIALSGTGVAQASHSVSLSWNASTSSVTGYNVYSSTVSGGPYTEIAPAIPTTSFTDSSVQAGLTYYFVVTSVNSQNEESSYSTQVAAVIP